jgi:hypothetical protein
LRRAVAPVFLAQAHLALDPQLVHALFQEVAEARMMDAGAGLGVGRQRLIGLRQPDEAHTHLLEMSVPS